MFTHKEQQNLSALLAKAVNPDDALTIDGLHGFLFGLAILPEPIMPGEWLPHVFGEEMMEFESEPQANEMLGHLFTAYNSMCELNRQDRLSFPFDMKALREDDVDRIIKWSEGLYMAMNLRPEFWGVAPSDEGEKISQEEAELLTCFMCIRCVGRPDEIADIFGDVGPDSPVGPTKSETERLGALFRTLPTAVETVRKHGNMLRKKAVRPMVSRPPSLPRRVDKVGRNEPCPCGSGKKFKKCCGA